MVWKTLFPYHVVSLKVYTCQYARAKMRYGSYTYAITYNESIVVAMLFCAPVYMCLVVTCWERAYLLALVCCV